MPIKLNTASGGGVTLSAANTATDKTITVPAVDGTMNMSGAANEVPAGSASAPAIYPTGDTNTGIFFPAADAIAFSEGGVESMRIDSSGNVGIGTNSPGARLDVSASSQPVIRLTSGQDFSSGGAADPFGTLQFYTTDTSGIGARTVGSIATIADTSSTAPGGVMVFSTAATNAAATERARIDSSGNFLIGNTNGDARLYVLADGNAVDPMSVANSNSGSSSQYAIVFRRNTTTVVGSIQTTNAATSYLTSSDYRLKDNVQPMTGALAKVAALKPCTYTWKDGGSAGEGFIAHELAEVVPQAVAGEKDAVNEDGSIKPQGIDTSFLVATLTAAIKEQQQMIETLQAKVAALEAQ